MNKAVFLDRDGVINVDTGYVENIDNIQWNEGIFKGLSKLINSGYLLFVVTNQSGVARGYFSENDVVKLHKSMQKKLSDNGIQITEFTFCPHHPDGIVLEYKKICCCRKPEPGMINNLILNYEIDRKKSFLIGDKNTDLEAAAAARITSYLFRGEEFSEYKYISIIFRQKSDSKYKSICSLWPREFPRLYGYSFMWLILNQDSRIRCFAHEANLGASIILIDYLKCGIIHALCIIILCHILLAVFLTRVIFLFSFLPFGRKVKSTLQLLSHFEAFSSPFLYQK